MERLSVRLDKLSTRAASHSIYKVPMHLRDVNNKAFEPEMTAIGPYCGGKPKLKNMEEVKLRYMESLLARKPDVLVEQYISAIEEIVERARDCYAEPSRNFDSTIDFTDMLVLDGCFIIEVIQSPQLFLLSFPDRSNHRILQRDLILLENQIPFFVLCKLFDLIQGRESHLLLMKRVLRFFRNIFPGKVLYENTLMRSSESVKHILDLIHINWCPFNLPVPVPVQGCCASHMVIPSASKLKDANVKFRNKEYVSEPDLNIFRVDRCTSLFDVEFKNGGKMVMPSLVIDDYTESLLRNLIAYEQLFPWDEPTWVADYAILLDCLINTSKDVQILCREKIIENMLGSDKAVKKFVNRLTESVVLNVNSFMYADTFHRINLHHKKYWNRAVAAFHRDYFSSAWAYIAFLGALMLLLLAVAQTVFAVLQLYKPDH
ncbi:hypothetical protein ACS0TY_032365 [Phlomoides rotata]